MTTLHDHPAHHDHPIHPVAELFPVLDGANYRSLVTSAGRGETMEPVWLTPDGQLISGLDRYRACREVGVTPRYQVHEGDPWVFAASRHAHLPATQRAMIAARIAARHRHADKTELIPSKRSASRLLGVAYTTVERARVIVTHGTSGLRELVEAELMPITIGERVARLSVEDQDRVVTAVRSGRTAHEAETAGNRRTGRAPSSGRRKTFYSNSSVANRDAVLRITSSVTGFGIGLRDINGIDPAISDEEATRWANDLSTGITNLRKLTKLLRERTR